MLPFSLTLRVPDRDSGGTLAAFAIFDAVVTELASLLPTLSPADGNEIPSGMGLAMTRTAFPSWHTVSGGLADLSGSFSLLISSPLTDGSSSSGTESEGSLSGTLLYLLPSDAPFDTPRRLDGILSQEENTEVTVDKSRFIDEPFLRTRPVSVTPSLSLSLMALPSCPASMALLSMLSSEKPASHTAILFRVFLEGADAPYRAEKRLCTVLSDGKPKAENGLTRFAVTLLPLGDCHTGTAILSPDSKSLTFTPDASGSI